MTLFLCVLADVIHFTKILVTCNMFFSFRMRETEHKKLKLIIAGLVVGGMSAIINSYNHEIVETFIYIFTIMILVFILYKETIYSTVITTMWIMVALSMIDTMTFILYDITMEIFNVNGEPVSKLIVALISLVMVFVLGRIYRRNAPTTLRTIGTFNLIGFTLLLAVDTFIVMAIISQPNVDLYMENKRTLYLISIVLVIIGIFIQLAAVILLFTQRNVYKEKEEIIDRYLNEQKSHYEYLENREKETKKFRHDLRSHMEMISNLAKNHEYDKIDDYLEKMHFKIEKFGNIVTVQNGIVDAIINQYYEKAMQNGVTMEVKGRFPMDCTIDAYDLCTIFSNVLSNSLEAAIETEEKYISLECGYTDKSIIIVVKNSFNAEIQNGNRQWRSRKPDADYHGYGLENIKESVNKYSGVFDIETEGNIFCMKILFSYIGK